MTICSEWDGRGFVDHALKSLICPHCHELVKCLLISKLPNDVFPETPFHRHTLNFTVEVTQCNFCRSYVNNLGSGKE
jgi:hypothetical protein